MARVLIIDDDANTLHSYKRLLRAADHEVTTVSLGEDGVAAAQRDQFDVLLCDQRLPDQPGIEVVSLIHRICPRIAIVFVTGWGTSELAIAAKRAGATIYAAKPLDSNDLTTIVDDALRLRATQDTRFRNPIGYAARRWADVIAQGALLPDDPSTILAWCRGVATARSTLQHRCNAVDVTPKCSLDLMRLLRIVMHHAGEPWDLSGWLNSVDSRTTRALKERSGLPSDCRLVPSVDSFLSHQRLIVRADLIEALRLRLLGLLPRW